MAKHNKKVKNNNLKKQHKKIDKQYDYSQSLSIKKILIIIIVILCIFGVFYLLTVGILNKKDKKNKTSNTTIQYTEILAGESFTQKTKEYLVYFYDSSSDDVDNDHTIISNYREKKNSLTMYTVDMHEGLNKNFRGEDNLLATTASELQISKSTVIHIKDGEIIDYINENIEDYLNK